MNSVAAMDHFCSKKSIDEVIDNSTTLQLSKRESGCLNNRKVMKRLIDIIICLVKCSKTFHGHGESSTSHQKDLYLEIMQILYKYDKTLKNHVDDGPKNTIYASNVIQNYIIRNVL